MMKHSSLQSIFVLVAIFLLASATGWAQDARISGTVTDSTGGVIPGVEVTVTNLGTGVTRQAVTDDSGRYSVPQLFAGNYRVGASMSGFDAQQLELLLDPGQTTEQNFELAVGAPTNVVEVASSAARINVNPYEMATVIEEHQIQQLPLNGRNVLALAGLVPGILKGQQGGRGDQMEDGFKSGGLAMEHVAISLDGIDNTGRVVFGPLAQQSQAAKPPPEAIAEFKVITNNTSAEYGAKAGATILISTKGGTNQLHGGVYHFNRNAAVSANNFMFNRDAPRDANDEITHPNPPYNRNQFGGTIGGPIVKDKTFFFFSFQGTRLISSGNSFLRRVPSTLARQGDFSGELSSRNGRSPDIYDPLTLTGTGAAAERQQFANNVIPQNRMDPAAIQVLALMPMPNVEGANFEIFNYFYAGRNHNENELYDFRIDHNFNDNHRIFGRYSYRRENSVFGLQMPFPTRGTNFSRFRTKQFAMNYNATLAPNIHNEFRGGFSQFPASRFDDHTENLNDKFGIPNAPTSQYPERAPDNQEGLVYFNYSNIYELLGGGSAGGTIAGNLDTMTIANNLLWDTGNHSLKFGVEYREWNNLRSQLFGNDQGQMLFDGRYTAQFPNVGGSRRNTGHAIADTLLGWPRFANGGLPVGEDMNIPYWGFYVQDDWRITPKLTLNLGLRYELFMQPRINDGSHLQNAKPNWIHGVIPETPDPFDVRFDTWQFPQNSSDCGCELDKQNWAPRIGLAYRVANNTVIRTGAGLYYSENSAAGIDSNRYNSTGPVVTSLTVNPGSFEVPALIVSEGFPDYTIDDNPPIDIYPSAWVGGEGASNVPTFKKTINVYQWFFDVQHQLPWDVLMTVGYNGTAAHNLPWWTRNFSQEGVPGNLPAGNPARQRVSRNPADTNSTVPLRTYSLTGDNVLNSNYNAFTFKTEKRFSEGLSFTSSFTWSKGLDYGVSSLNERTEGIVGGANPLTPYAKDLWRNRGPGGLSRDFAYALSALYELPAGPGKGRFESGPASWVLGGWQLGTILSLQTGPWATTLFTPNTANAGGAYRGILVGNPNLPESERDSRLWWNRSAISGPAPGAAPAHGDVGRGILELPGWKNFDFLMSKYFNMPWEGHRLQFRFEAFNLTNTPHLGAPNANPVRNINAAAASAVIITRADLPRIIQFALKYNF